MIILTIRTDKPEAEIGLYDDQVQVTYETWAAHRELGRTIHTKLVSLTKSAGKELSDVQAIVVLKGPGSFTGLRIGLTVANALAYSLRVPIVGSSGEAWAADGISRLLRGESDVAVMPEYGAEVNITTPRT